MVNQSIKVQTWTNNNGMSETSIRQRLAAEGLRSYRWSNGPGDIYSVHSHAYHKVIYVVDGSITFGLPEAGDKVELKAGDRMELPAGVPHDALVGSQGVICLEAHL